MTTTPRHNLSGALALLTGLTLDEADVLLSERGLRGLLADHGTLVHSKGQQRRIDALGTLCTTFTTEARSEKPRIGEPGDVFRLLGPALRDLQHEEFHILALDTRSRVLRDILISKGTLEATSVHPRETFRAAIKEAAAGIILVHNHPSGDPTPSAEDCAMTRQSVAAGQLLDLPVYDHVIIAGDRFVSFATAGLLG